MKNVLYSVCILLVGFLLIGCIPVGGETVAVSSIVGLFTAEEKVDVAFYSSSGSEIVTAPASFMTTYKAWIIPQGEQDVFPRSGDLAKHRVQNNGDTTLYIFFEVYTEEINGKRVRTFPKFQYFLGGDGWYEDGSLRRFYEPIDPDFSTVLEAYRIEADCPDLAACEYVIVIPPGESRMFRYANE